MKPKQKFPGYNCGQCGYATCDELLKSKKPSSLCVFIKDRENAPVIAGVIDSLSADFKLAALPKHKSCIEYLLPLCSLEIQKGDVIRYRPLGCPIVHFAKVLNVDYGVIQVTIEGPLKRDSYKEVGICIVLGFEGMVSAGTVPKMCETVRFIPEYCMMQKVHTGVVVSVEGRRLRIEGIDLKVWQKGEL